MYFSQKISDSIDGYKILLSILKEMFQKYMDKSGVLS